MQKKRGKKPRYAPQRYLHRIHARFLNLSFSSETDHLHSHRTCHLAGSALIYSHERGEAYPSPRGRSDGSYRERTTEQRTSAGEGYSQSPGGEVEVAR